MEKKAELVVRFQWPGPTNLAVGLGQIDRSGVLRQDNGVFLCCPSDCRLIVRIQDRLGVNCGIVREPLCRLQCRII